MTQKSETPEAPNEPDVFEDQDVNADESAADFEAEETNKKEVSE